MPSGADIISLGKQQIWSYFKWGFIYVSFNPMGLASRYGYNGRGLWTFQMKNVDPSVPSLYVPDNFRVSISRVEYNSSSKNLAVGESYVMNLPSVPNWYTGEVYYLDVNANASQVDVSDALLYSSYHSIDYDYSNWIPYNQTIVIKNIWTGPLSLSIWSSTFIFRYIDHEINWQSLNFTIDSMAFDSTRAGYYFTLDVTAPISLNSTSLFVPNGSRTDALYRILKDSIDYSYYTLEVTYGIYKVSFYPYYAWMVLENGIYGNWCLMLEIPSDSNPPIIGVPLQEPDQYHVEPSDNVTVSVNVTDMEGGVREVILSYTTDDGITWKNVTMNYNSTTALYEGTIGNQSYGTWVKYKIIAYDNAGNPAVKDNAGGYYVYQVIPEFPTFWPLLIVLIILAAAIILLSKTMTAQGKQANSPMQFKHGLRNG